MRSIVPLALVGGLVGCAQKNAATPAATASPEDTGASNSGPPVVDPPTGDYLAPEDPDSAADLDITALSAAVNEALAVALRLHGGPPVAAYRELIAEADASCPVFGTSGGTPYWFDSCTTAAGAHFDGYGYQYEYVDQADGETTWNGFAVSMAGSITGAGGATLEGSGSAAFLTGGNIYGQDVWYSVVQPGFSWNGASAEGTWLADGLDPDLVWYAVRGVDDIGAAATLNGSAGVGSESVAALVFSDILLIDEAFGSSCPMEPAGSISVLDNEGHWIDMEFDGPAWEGTPTPEALCDGCGAAWYRGTYLGEVCVDFAPLADWSSYPFGSPD